ncbi:ABC transporter ATP-binding protein [Gorillibacterium sp. CAU 1737]|uniref:ABC transporter ATP-binding protein n=1 Tax=Gorillibacterium sp. CAU 1737 TaxID=3140362 RepID=UPI003261900D
MPKPNNRTMKQAFAYLHGFRGKLAFLLIVIIIGIALNNVSPILYGRLIDAITAKEFSQTTVHLMFFAAITIAIVLLSSLESVVSVNVGNRIINHHQTRCFSKLLKTQMSHVEKFEFGLLVSNLTSDISTIVRYNIELLTTVIFMSLNFIVPLLFIFLINWKLALVTIAFLPVTMVIYYAHKNKKKLFFKQSREMDDKYYAFVCNSIRNIPSFKAYKLEEKISGNFEELMDDSYQKEKNKTILDTFVGMLNDLSQNIFSFVLLYLAARLIVNDELSIGVLMSFTIYTNRLFSSITTLQKIKLDEQPVRVALDRLSSLLAAPEDDYSRNRQNLATHQTKLELDHLSFHYDDLEVIKGLSLTIQDKGFYSLVGENGSGKTTLFKLMMDFYQAQSGQLKLNDTPYPNLSSAYIRSFITYVHKDPFVVNDTLLENIRLYSALEEDQVLEVCERVGLKEFILSLPDKLDTMLFEDSDLLSSGMLQKLSFARALLHPSAIMLFDEITSDLDGKSEKQLCQIMKELSRDRIVLSISHRMNAIVDSDWIFVLEDGRIVDQGDFHTLSKTNVLFSNLFRAALAQHA